MNIINTSNEELYNTLLIEAEKYCNDDQLLHHCMRRLDLDRLLVPTNDSTLREAYESQARQMSHNASLNEPEEIGFDDNITDYPQAIAYYSISYALMKLLHEYFNDAESLWALANNIYDIGVPQENNGQYKTARATYQDAKMLVEIQIKNMFNHSSDDISTLLKSCYNPIMLHHAIESRLDLISKMLGDG